MVQLAGLRRRNPWVDLPTTSPYVLPADKPIIDAVHRNEREEHHYRLGFPPDPWQGRWDAPVLLLLQNPSTGSQDAITYADPAVLAANRRNMSTNAGEEPMYWLEDEVAHTYSGRWWRARLKALISEAGLDAVRNHLLVVELYGYRSPTFRPLPITLPSQTFSLEIVEVAMSRGQRSFFPVPRSTGRSHFQICMDTTDW